MNEGQWSKCLEFLAQDKSGRTLLDIQDMFWSMNEKQGEAYFDRVFKLAKEDRSGKILLDIRHVVDYMNEKQKEEYQKLIEESKLKAKKK